MSNNGTSVGLTPKELLEEIPPESLVHGPAAYSRMPDGRDGSLLRELTAALADEHGPQSPIPENRQDFAAVAPPDHDSSGQDFLRSLNNDGPALT